MYAVFTLLNYLFVFFRNFIFFIFVFGWMFLLHVPLRSSPLDALARDLQVYLSNKYDITLDVENVNIQWGGLTQPLLVRMNDLTLHKKIFLSNVIGDVKIQSKIKTIFVSLNAWDLLQGKYFAKDVALVEADTILILPDEYFKELKFVAFQDEEDIFYQELKKNWGRLFYIFFEALKDVNSLRFSGGGVIRDYSNQNSLVLSSVEGAIQKETNDFTIVDVTGKIFSHERGYASVKLEVRMDHVLHKTEVALQFDRLDYLLTIFQEVFDKYYTEFSLNLNIELRVFFTENHSGDAEKDHLEFAGAALRLYKLGEGVEFIHTSLLGNASLGVQDIGIQEFFVNIFFTPKFQGMEVLDAKIVLAHGTELNFSGTFDFIFPYVFVARPHILLASISDLHDYWPKDVASNLRAWLLKNMSRGKFSSDVFRIEMKKNEKDRFFLSDIQGMLVVNKTSLNYMDGMPPLHNLDASLKFSPKSIQVTLEKASINNHQATSGQFTIFNPYLVEDIPLAMELVLPVVGEIQPIFSIIESPPLRYLSSVGLKPSMFSGQIKGNFFLNFMLEKGKVVEGIGFSFQGEAKNFAMKGGIYKDKVLDKASISFDMEDHLLSITGSGFFDNNPMNFEYWKDFKTKEPLDGQLYFSFYDINAENLKNIFFFPETKNEFLQGRLSLWFHLNFYRNGRKKVFSFVDLKDSQVTLPMFFYTKSLGTEGSLAFTVEQENQFWKAMSFEYEAAGLSSKDSEIFQGKGTFSDKNIFQAGTLEVKNIGKNTFSLIYNRDLPSQQNLRVEGKSMAWDIFYSVDKAYQVFQKNIEIPGSEKQEIEAQSLGNLDIMMDITQLYVADQPQFIENYRGNIHMVHGQIHQLSAQGLLLSKDPLTLSVERTGLDGNRKFLLETLNFEGLYGLFLDPFFVRGTCKLEGEITGDNRYEGRATFQNIAVEEGPDIFKVIDTLFFLKGQFQYLVEGSYPLDEGEFDFVYDQGVMSVQNGLFRSDAQGFTFAGDYFMEDQFWDMTGTFVPFYFFNTLLGKIPLVGNLFSNFEDNGGVFAFSWLYQGKYPDGNLLVNYLSGFIPGVFRSFISFGIQGFDSNVRIDDYEGPQRW